ncbi:MAG TPA: TonB-dependent receptor [Vicinamibacterales bacterium]|nr:TonB-dependent receptor [Vicinamibacterales bacterium]
MDTRRRERGQAVSLLLCFLLSLGMLLGPARFAQAQERAGTITGTLTDASGGVMPGVTVTITNNETKRSTVVVTGDDGVFSARALDPGRYTVRFELSGFAPQEAPNVILLLGATATVDATLKVGALTEAVQVIANTSLIDTGAMTRQRNIPAEEFDIIPKGRSFQALATALPSVNSGELEGGFQVNGASAGENNFLVDGVSVVSLVHGNQRQDAVFEYLQEVQVKTSGLEAEFGGALGGVISAVTKSGGNTFMGSVFYHYTGNRLRSSSGIEQRLVIDPATQNRAYFVQDDDQTFNRSEIGGSLGGPIVTDRLFFFGSVSPRMEKLTRNYVLDSGQSTSIGRDRKTWSAFGKLTYVPTNRLQLNGSTLWTPDKATGSPVGYDGATENSSTSSLAGLVARQTLGFEVPQWNASYSADYTLSDTMLVSVRGGFMKDNYFDTGVSKAQTFEYATSAVGLAGVPAQFAQPAGYSNLPRTNIKDHDITTRQFADVSLSKTVAAGGHHQFKGGFGYARATNDVDLAYPNGGYVTVFWNSVYTSDVPGVGSGRGTYGYYTIDDFGTKGKTGANILSLFVQDNWSVTDRLTLNLGIRSENEDIPSFRPDIQKVGIHFGWGQKISPRAGVAYDVFGDGRMKISGSYGRYYDWTKYELARGTFGGDIWTTRFRSLDDPDPTKLSRAALTGRNLWNSEPDSYKDSRIPSFGSDVVDPKMKPMAQNTYNLGAEYQVAANTTFGINFVRTNLLRTIEDIGTLVDGSEAYIYANPGEGLGKVAITTGRTPPYDMPKPKRNYTALEFTANRRVSRNWFLGGSYVFSRLYGNYPGLVNTDEVTAPGRVSVGAQEAFGQRVRPGTNASRAWDLDEMMFDSHGNLGVDGLLPTDRPHVGKVYGSYRFDFGTNVGVNFYAGSGTPVSKSVQSVYRYPILVEGRGSLGRTPTLTQTNLLVSHEFGVASGKRIRLEFNALNVFDQKQVRHVFDTVNRIGANGRVLPSSALRLVNENLQNGYNYEALLAATPDAAKPAGTAGAGYRDPRYQMGDMFNPGFQGLLTIRFLF